MVHDTFEELPNCVGWIDGTHIKLAESPLVDHESYFNKNKDYSLQVQLICDHKKRIRNYVAGYPGSVHDSRVWNECVVKRQSHVYFTDEEYLSGDLGYALSSIMMVPFKDNSLEASATTRSKYNKHFSKFRVKIEHVNGILNETFGSLKELRIKIKDKKTHKEATQWIVACLILYNIILPFNVEDETEEIHFVPDEDDDLSSFDVDDAKKKRLAICDFINNKF